MANDYLAMSDDKLVIFTENLIEAAENNREKWEIPEAVILALSPLLTDFTKAVSTLHNPDKRVPSNTRIKNDARKALEAKLRPFIQRWFELNDAVTPSDLESLSLPVHDTKPTIHQPPAERVAIAVRVSGDLQHILTALNPLTEKPVKPADAAGVKIVRTISDSATPPVDPETMGHSVFSRKTKVVFDYTGSDLGKWVHYCARYENSKGEPGPWSKIVSTLIA